MKGHVQHGAAGTPEDFSYWRVTTDTLTGKKFRWNHTVVFAGHTVPARSTARRSTWLHPSRVPPALLAELNPPKVTLPTAAEHRASCDGTLLPPVLDNGLWICETCSFAIERRPVVGGIGPTSTATTLGEPRADVAAATMPNACTKCGTPTAHTEDWTLWPWPDGAWLCSTCNDQRHEVEEYP
jgi:hypothetical protein